MKKDSDQHAAFAPPPVNEVSSLSVFKWLSLGWQEMWRIGFPSLLHGLIVTLISIIIVEITLFFWPLLPGAVSGFLLTGPFLATGLYVLSMKLEKGHKGTFRDVIHAWRQSSHTLLGIGLILVGCATAWVIFSMVMFHYFIDIVFAEPIDFLRYVLTQDDTIFMLWTILGGLGLALTFAITVISIPLLMERNISTRQAILTSVRTVGQNPVTMVLWAMIIFILTGLSFVTLMLGFILLYPLLGHASWHVYRDLVDTRNLPLRSTLK